MRHPLIDPPAVWRFRVTLTTIAVKVEGLRVRRLNGPGLLHLVQTLLLALALAVPWGRALASDSPLQVSQYAHTSWSSRDGAQLGLVFGMAQTHDGYLWLAGSYGLFRFDGLRFVPWQPPGGDVLPSGPYSLLVSRDGTLWIGTFGGLASWDGHEYIRRHAEVGNFFVTSLHEARDGTVWVGVLGPPGRLCAIRAGVIRCYSPEGGFGTDVWSLAEDSTGTLWVGAGSGLWRWDPQAPRRHALPDAHHNVGDLSTTADGQVLVGFRGGGLWQLAGERFVPYRFQKAGQQESWFSDRDIKSNKLLRDRDGGLWIGTEGRGLIHVKNGVADLFGRDQGLSGNVSCSLFEDREGNIWYGSEKGVDRFSKLPVTTLSTRQGLPVDVVRSVLAARDGSLWAATTEGLVRWRDDRLYVYKEREGLPDLRVMSLYQDPGGRLWASTPAGLVYFENERFVTVNAGPSTEVNSMTGDAQGNLWLSGNQGLAHLQHGRLIGNLPWASLGHPQAQVIVADRGGLWMAFLDGSGVAYYKDGQIQASYSFPHEPGHGHVTGLWLDADGAVWAATGDAGLQRIKDGQVTALGRANGLPCDIVHWTVQDDSGAMWLYTACGLLRVSREDLAAWLANPAHQVVARVWGPADGVPLTRNPPARFNPPVAKRPDGTLWFAAGAELQRIDPEHMFSNPVPPPVHIASLVVDHRPYAVANGLRLPPLSRDLAIEFAALSLVDPRTTRFRFRLEGHDNDWQEAVDRRLATYTNLPPGNYRFRVKAANNSGLWNEEGAQLEFSIEPAYYQTTWFRLLVPALVLGGVWGALQLRMQLRIRRLQRQFEVMLEARVAERTRIARDLHDTLLQRFHGLLLQFQAAFNLLPDRPRDSKQVLARAIDQVAVAVTEGRDAVQGLRSPVLEAGALADALKALADDLADEAGQVVRAHIAVQGTPLDLQAPVRDGAFRIAGEALRNAFHHAQARQIQVEIGYEERQLRVRVRDDGKGIDPQVLTAGARPGHFGLGGMRESAALMGGTLLLQSDPATGTQVELRVPALRAYSRPPSARTWGWRKPFAPHEP